MRHASVLKMLLWQGVSWVNPQKKRGGGSQPCLKRHMKAAIVAWSDIWWEESVLKPRRDILGSDSMTFFFFGGGGEGFSPQTPNLVDKTVRRRPTKNSPEAMSEKEILKRPTTKTVSPQAPEIFRSTKKSQQRHAHKDRRVTPVGFKTTVLGSDSPYFFLSCCCFVSFYDPKFRRILS